MNTPRPVALITGASRGIGAATARELGRRGYHVIVNYRVSAEAAGKVAGDVEAAGGTATPIAADVTDPAQVQALTETVTTEFGGIDVLVCNANAAQPPVAPLAGLSWQEFIGKVSGELAGAFFITQRVLEAMQPRGSGRIIYISSVAAETTRTGWISHSTAKAALNTFSRHVAAEAGRYGITVNTIAPGAVRTEASAGIVTAELEERIQGTSVLGRMLEPEDVASVVGTLADTTMGAVTGTLIRVDAGSGILSGGRSSRV